LAQSFTPRHRFRRVVLAALVAVLAATIAAVPSSAGTATAPSASGTGSAAVPKLHWGSCAAEGEGLGAFQCATAVVPLDYDKPKGKQITLALARLPASNPSRKIGSLFLNPGGPGGSGVDFLFGAGPFLYSDEVRARFDLVGFDPRGIIRSTPLRCFDSLEEAAATLPPFPFPYNREEERVWVQSDRALARACAEHAGPILDHMSTANVARDMDLLRRAVGDTKLTYAGYSYGSYLGSTYANLFPTKVRALVVDGVLDPVAWSTGRGDQARTLPFSTRLRSAKGAYETLQEFLRLCDAGGPNCAFSQGSPKRRFDRLAKRLLREPSEFTDPTTGETFVVTYNELIGATLGVLYDPAGWSEWAVVLQALDEQTRPAAAAAALRALRARLGGGAFQQEDYPNFVEGFPGVACSETHNPSNVGAWSRAARAQDRQFPYFGRPWTWFSSACEPWPGWDDDHFDGPWSHATANPVLVVGNLFDPATPYHGAVTVDRLLPNSRLLTLAGWGHTSLFTSACIDASVSAYLLTSRVPPKGTVCQPDVVPFAEPAAAQAQRAGAASKTALIPPMLRRMLTG
jgi:pimeloyl-ACP methyl ester carboxylesterase